MIHIALSIFPLHLIAFFFAFNFSILVYNFIFLVTLFQNFIIIHSLLGFLMIYICCLFMVILFLRMSMILKHHSIGLIHELKMSQLIKTIFWSFLILSNLFEIFFCLFSYASKNLLMAILNIIMIFIICACFSKINSWHCLFF